MIVRRGLAVLLLGLVAGGLTACGNGNARQELSGVPRASVTPLGLPAGSGVPKAPQPAQTLHLTVTNGQVTGDTGEVPVRLGSRVRLVVVSDVAGQLHVSGYDLTQEVPIGRPAALEFRADRAGLFDVELSDQQLLLTRLRVR